MNFKRTRSHAEADAHRSHLNDLYRVAHADVSQQFADSFKPTELQTVQAELEFEIEELKKSFAKYQKLIQPWLQAGKNANDKVKELGDLALFADEIKRLCTTIGPKRNNM